MKLKVDPVELKEKTLKLIEEHNTIEGNKKVKPINNYGSMNTVMSLFWALWDDEIKSTHNIGFNYKGDKLVEFGKDEEIFSIEEALEKLKQQLLHIK